eukprot:Rhum_TRINITY_DN12526_c1_g1::Rhum_TRINITY_DN12526_c1_g1_i1::g.52644::m.52644
MQPTCGGGACVASLPLLPPDVLLRLLRRHGEVPFGHQHSLLKQPLRQDGLVAKHGADLTQPRVRRRRWTREAPDTLRRGGEAEVLDQRCERLGVRLDALPQRGGENRGGGDLAARADRGAADGVLPRLQLDVDSAEDAEGAEGAGVEQHSALVGIATVAQREALHVHVAQPHARQQLEQLHRPNRVQRQVRRELGRDLDVPRGPVGRDAVAHQHVHRLVVLDERVAEVVVRSQHVAQPPRHHRAGVRGPPPHAHLLQNTTWRVHEAVVEEVRLRAAASVGDEGLVADRQIGDRVQHVVVSVALELAAQHGVVVERVHDRQQHRLARHVEQPRHADRRGPAVRGEVDALQLRPREEAQRAQGVVLLRELLERPPQLVEGGGGVQNRDLVLVVEERDGGRLGQPLDVGGPAAGLALRLVVGDEQVQHDHAVHAAVPQQLPHVLVLHRTLRGDAARQRDDRRHLALLDALRRDDAGAEPVRARLDAQALVEEPALALDEADQVGRLLHLGVLGLAPVIVRHRCSQQLLQRAADLPMKYRYCSFY